MGVCTLAFDGSLPLGYLLMGWLTGRYGAPAALLSLLVAGIGRVWMRCRAAEEDAADRAR